MRRWGLAYLGRSSFPKDVSEFELQRAFTFDHRERRDIRRAFRVRYRLPAALQLGFLRLAGKALASVAYVPTSVLHEENLKLTRALNAGLRYQQGTTAGGLSETRMVIPIDGEKVTDLFALITRGLIYWHWGRHLPLDYTAYALVLRDAGQAYWDRLT
jgi:hypothetical protein